MWEIVTVACVIFSLASKSLQTPDLENANEDQAEIAFSSDKFNAFFSCLCEGDAEECVVPFSMNMTAMDTVRAGAASGGDTSCKYFTCSLSIYGHGLGLVCRQEMDRVKACNAGVVSQFMQIKTHFCCDSVCVGLFWSNENDKLVLDELPPGLENCSTRCQCPERPVTTSATTLQVNTSSATTLQVNTSSATTLQVNTTSATSSLDVYVTSNTSTAASSDTSTTTRSSDQTTSSSPPATVLVEDTTLVTNKSNTSFQSDQGGSSNYTELIQLNDDKTITIVCAAVAVLGVAIVILILIIYVRRRRRQQSIQRHEEANEHELVNLNAPNIEEEEVEEEDIV